MWVNLFHLQVHFTVKVTRDQNDWKCSFVLECIVRAKVLVNFIL